VLRQLTPAPPTQIHLRDGEVVVFRRGHSPFWQCRYRLQTLGWVRTSTRQAALENAVRVACDYYDEARFRQRLGLAHKGWTFAQLAHETLNSLRREMDGGRGRSVYRTYITCIERYFLPYFQDRQIEQLCAKDVAEFEFWRNRQMQRVPMASTLNNFASAWNRLIQTGVEQGAISSEAKIPRLSTRGVKSTPRPAFNREEVEQLLAYMPEWTTWGRLAIEREVRPLVRDYVEILLWSGIRHGTEAMGLCWKDIEWHQDKGTRYLRFWVSGKTGGRWLIARHRAVEALQRLHVRQKDISGMAFEDLLKSRCAKPVFRFTDGYQPPSFIGTFRRLMRDSGLLKGEGGQNRTLYSLRHTYATFALLDGMDIHTLAKQLGNSEAMIERHYSKLTPMMVAGKLG